MKENEIATIIVAVVIKVHKALGPGLFESVYESIVAHELACNYGLNVERQVKVPVKWEGLKLDIGFRADMIVEKKVLIEFKTVDGLQNVHFKQVLTYLKLTGHKLGMLINFEESLIKQGIKRIVNGL